MKRRGQWWAWLTFLIGMVYFLVPLIATFEFSLRINRGAYSFDAYRLVFASSQFQQSFTYSVLAAIFTILLGILIVVPTAYWVRLRVPHLRPIVEFVTLLPLVIPAIVIVFGYIRLYGTNSWLPFLAQTWSTNVLLVIGYAILALPYMYRAVDTGLRTIDVKTLTEAAQIMGRVGHNHCSCDPAQCPHCRPVRSVPDVRRCPRRVHHGLTAQQASVRPLHAEPRCKPCL